MASAEVERERSSAMDVREVNLFGERLAGFISSRKPQLNSTEGKEFIENAFKNLEDIVATCIEYKGVTL